LGLGIVCLAHTVQGADWPTWRHDAARSAATEEELAAELHLQWVLELAPPAAAWPRSQVRLQFDASYEPVVMGKTMFVGSMVADCLSAYATETGAEKWRFHADGPVRFAPVAHGGKVYFVSDDGFLYCLDADSGSLLWKFRGGPSHRKVIGNHRLVSMWPARGGPVLYDGKVYFAAGIWPFMGTFIHALDAETGGVVWTNSGSGSTYMLQPHHSAAFAGVAPQGYLVATPDVLLVSGGRSVPAAYNRKTGRFLYYRVSEFDKIGDYAVAAADRWFFNDGVMYEIAGGDSVLPVPDGVYTPEAVYYGHGSSLVAAALPPQEIEETDEEGETHRRLALKPLWQAVLPDAPERIFLKAAGRLYGADAEGSVVAIDIAGGHAVRVSWRGKVEGTPWSMLAADGRLFVVTREGRVYCFGAEKVAPRTHPLRRRELPATQGQWAERAGEILERTGVEDGYCLVLGVESGRLIEELLRQSRLSIIAVDPDVNKVRALREKLYDLAEVPQPEEVDVRARPVEIEWPRQWQVLGPFPKGSAPLPPSALQSIPERWSLDGETYVTKPLKAVRGVLDFSYLHGGYGVEPLGPGEQPGPYPRPEAKRDPGNVARTAYAFARINCPTAGKLTIGAGADWWMAWYLDGKPLYDTLERGNEALPFGDTNHVFSVDVAAGEHVIAVMVRAGSKSWMVASGGGAAFERIIGRTPSALVRRFSFHAGDLPSFGFPPYLASLIVSERPLPAALAQPERLFETLRPYGGVACLSMTETEHEDFARLVADASLQNAQVERVGELSMLRRVGGPSGSASWTHQYADSANTVVSKDELVKAPLGLLWFGGPPNDPVLPRHGHGPSPQVIGGRLFIEGANMLRAVDVYTGRLLWERELPGIGKPYDTTAHQAGANEVGSNYASAEDGVYVISPRSCLRLDPATGRTLSEFILPAAEGDELPRWGFIALWKDLLVATSSPINVPLSGDEEQDQAAMAALKDVPGVALNVDYAPASRALVVMDRHSGEVLWSRPAVYSYRHNTIAVGAGKVFCIDGMTAGKVDYLRRRGYHVRQKPTLYALDAATGGVLWKTDDRVFGTWLGYSAEHDVLLEAGSKARDRPADEVGEGMAARRGSDGAPLWRSDLAYGGPCMLHHDTIITQGYAVSLLSGKRRMRNNPLTGEPAPWSFTRNYGCNTAIASEHLVLFRSAAAGYFDLALDGGTGNLGGFKSGCTSNLIAADGVLSAPDYTRTCTCSYQNQASLAFVHMPEAEVWTFNPVGRLAGRIRRVGINLGAPGDRMADEGTLWLDIPSVGGPSPAVRVDIDMERPEWFRHHSSLIRYGSHRWVAASGVRGSGRIRVGLVPPAGVMAPRCDTPPVIDGKLDDVCWAGAESVPFEGDAHLLEPETQLFLRRDAYALYIGYRRKAPLRNGKPLPFRAAQTGDDAATWEDDEFEAFLTDGTHRTAMQLGISCSGGRFDGLNTGPGQTWSDVSWNGEWTFAVLSDEAEWSAEVAIPLATLRAIGIDTERLELNLLSQNLSGEGPRAIFLTHPGPSRRFGLCSVFLRVVDTVPPATTAVYTVRLHFAEPDDVPPGAAAFNVALQGTEVLRDFDVVSEAGGPRRAIVREFRGIEAQRALTITLGAAEQGVPLLCGIELVAEGP